MAINTIRERKRLENIKKQLEDLKEEQREKETEKKIILKKLKEDFECKSIKEAEELLEEMDEEVEELEKKITEKTEKLIEGMKAEGLV
jgi:hypothetical protein